MIAQANEVKAERERTGALMDMAGTMLKGEELAGFQSMVATGNFNELSAGFASGAPEILEFIDPMLQVNPFKRASFEEMMNHPFMQL
jgi:serine/threonine protein kinase